MDAYEARVAFWNALKDRLTHTDPSVKHLCPVCQQHYFQNEEEYAQCPVCHCWNDIVGEMLPDASCENCISLNEAIEMYRKGIPLENPELGPDEL